MKGKFTLLALIMASTFIGQAFAHHSFSATYNADKTVKIEGSVKEFLWRNPHSFIRVEAPDEKGVMQVWSLEWGGGAQLQGMHVTRESVKPGDHVIVTGQPGRDPSEHRIRLQTIMRTSDGWKWEGVVR